MDISNISNLDNNQTSKRTIHDKSLIISPENQDAIENRKKLNKKAEEDKYYTKGCCQKKPGFWGSFFIILFLSKFKVKSYLKYLTLNNYNREWQ